jgi:uncharacterized protein (UPF0128 family)
MKAIDLLKELCSLNLDLEQCGVITAETLFEVGVLQYFGMPINEGTLELNKTYFWVSANWQEEPSFSDGPSVIIGDEDELSWYFLYELKD